MRVLVGANSIFELTHLGDVVFIVPASACESHLVPSFRFDVRVVFCIVIKLLFDSGAGVERLVILHFCGIPSGFC